MEKSLMRHNGIWSVEYNSNNRIRNKLLKYCLTAFSATRENSSEDISFSTHLASSFQKNPKTLSEHQSQKTCANDLENTKETIKVFCLTNKTSSAFERFHRSERPFCWYAFCLHFCHHSVKLRQFCLMIWS